MRPLPVDVARPGCAADQGARRWACWRRARQAGQRGCGTATTRGLVASSGRAVRPRDFSPRVYAVHTLWRVNSHVRRKAEPQASRDDGPIMVAGHGRDRGQYAEIVEWLGCSRRSCLGYRASEWCKGCSETTWNSRAIDDGSATPSGEEYLDLSRLADPPYGGSMSRNRDSSACSTNTPAGLAPRSATDRVGVGQYALGRVAVHDVRGLR